MYQRGNQWVLTLGARAKEIRFTEANESGAKQADVDVLATHVVVAGVFDGLAEPAPLPTRAHRYH